MNRVAVRVELDSELVEQASRAGLSISHELDRALRRKLGIPPGPSHSSDEAGRWARDNAGAIAATNARVDENGLWSDGYRVF
ncbi:MAG: type II toxin-antitoxin system CcdA family antitoxin [Methylobacteriaceae bacterium]|nr:type II toxin-antitoxin system CcdA family antitoxin [Methylobacteriaceae bacterium]